VPGDRIRRAEALPEDASEIEHEAERKLRVRQPEPLERRLSQDERFGLLERDDIRSSCRPGAAVETGSPTPSRRRS
jgi:hypothetical protein